MPFVNKHVNKPYFPDISDKISVLKSRSRVLLLRND